MGTAGAPIPNDSESLWTNRRAVAAHVALAIWFPGCIVACWWQVTVAEGGNALGWAYSVMWPFFAVFGVVFWWYLIHDDPESVGAKGLRRLLNTGQDAGEDDGAEPRATEDLITLAEQEDPELAAYNAYLAELARSNRPKTWSRR